MSLTTVIKFDRLRTSISRRQGRGFANSTISLWAGSSISFQPFQTILLAILVTVGFMPIFCQKSSANELNSALKVKIAQTPDADLQRRLENQREAERVLKEGERLKREVRDNNDNGYDDRGLGRQVGEQVNKVRESGSNPQKVREAEAELNRLRQQNNRQPYPYRYNYYNPFYYPSYTTAPIIFAPIYNIEPAYTNPPAPATAPTTAPAPASSNTTPEPLRPSTQIVQSDASSNSNSSNVSVLVSSGFKDGKIAPGLGVRYNNIGFEFAGIFNQDSLPGSVNDFSLPSNFLFNDLGIKKLSPQWGGDVLGFFDVDPRVSVYGSVGLYFQNTARIAQSQATNDLYKQTDETNVSGAVGGGVAYKASDNISVGVGYHSLRGVTARMGISF
jgi:opacity protein-like surface antigen